MIKYLKNIEYNYRDGNKGENIKGRNDDEYLNNVN